MAKLIGVNEQGRRVGEDHQNSVLTDHEVELLLDLHENHGFGYRRLARKFDLSRAAVRDICKYRHRAQGAARSKRCV